MRGSFGGDKNNIVWVGDSGGGLQATALCIKLRKEGRPKAIVLINPAEDLRHYEQSQLAMACDAYLSGKVRQRLMSDGSSRELFPFSHLHL